MKPLLFAPLALLFAGCTGSQPEKQAEPAPLPPKAAKILMFYPGSGVVARGEKVLLCYGVESAKAVRLDPPVEEIKPAYNHCLEAEPKVSTEYKLIATGEDGGEVTQSIAVKVQGVKKAEPGGGGGLITTFLATANAVPAGQEVTICYAAAGAESLAVEPAVTPTPAPPKGCFTAKPAQTTTYTLTAKGGGKSDQQKVTIKVQ